MNGVINVIKPPDMTSFDVVSFLRKRLKIKKIGHTGTLDPAAVGVLPICIGKATKIIEYLIEKDKLYRAEMKLGIVTDTYDTTGKVLYKTKIHISPEWLQQTLDLFLGEQLQIPPMYSAVKVNGKKLYELAREGIEIERNPRKINIYYLDLINYDLNDTVMFDVKCSKGTYIRTLCYDIGEKLGCGASLSFLVRMKSGMFSIKDAYTLEEIEASINKNNFESMLIKIGECLRDYRAYNINNELKSKFLNGGFIKLEDNIDNYDSVVPVYDEDNDLVGIGKIINKAEDIYLKPDKIM